MNMLIKHLKVTNTLQILDKIGASVIISITISVAWINFAATSHPVWLNVRKNRFKFLDCNLSFYVISENI
jgi:hypothetical protein